MSPSFQGCVSAGQQQSECGYSCQHSHSCCPVGCHTGLKEHCGYSYFFHFIKKMENKIHLLPLLFNGFIQTAQNGPSGGQGVDTALCQQVAAVSYSQEGKFSGLDVAPFKPQTDVRVAALPGAGAAPLGTFPAGQF